MVLIWHLKKETIENKINKIKLLIKALLHLSTTTCSVATFWTRGHFWNSSNRKAFDCLLHASWHIFWKSWYGALLLYITCVWHISYQWYVSIHTCIASAEKWYTVVLCIAHLISLFLKFSMWLIATQSGCCNQWLLLAAQMSSNWVAASPARLHLGCEGYVSQTVTRPRNPLCLSPADIHIHVTMPLWPETGFS